MIYPRSIFRLALIALLIVVLPLCAALLAVVWSVEKQVDTGQKTVMAAMSASRLSRHANERLDMVRGRVRDYVVEGGQRRFDFYLEARSGLVEALMRLQGLIGNGPDAELMTRLVTAELEWHARLAQFALDRKHRQGLYGQGELSRLTDEMVTRMEERVSQRLEQMEAAANAVGRDLLGPVLVMLVLTGVLSLLSTLMIARPIRRMVQAVKDLGEGQFDTPIVIEGPGDVVLLGEQLDWMRRRFQDLEEENARFLGDISHELKTPLAAIRESAELLADGSLGPLSGNQHEVADIMRDNSVKLQAIIEGLLNFNVRSVRRDPNHREVQSLERIAARVLASHRPMLRKKRMQVEENLSPARLKGDREELSVVVDNLISNAIKYSPIGGTLEVGVVSDGRRVVLDVRDEGPGIDAGDRERVFDAFFQGRPPEGEFVPSSGLGLAIAAEHVKAHGGELTIIDSKRSSRSGAHLRAVFPSDGRRRVPRETGEQRPDARTQQRSRWRERED